MYCCAGAPARPPARAAEPAAAQPAPPRAHRRTRLLLPALGVPPRRAPVPRLRAPLRPALAMRTHRGTRLQYYLLQTSDITQK